MAVAHPIPLIVPPARIRKLLALLDSPVQGEREAALARLHEIMQREGVRFADLGITPAHEKPKARERPPPKAKENANRTIDRAVYWALVGVVLLVLAINVFAASFALFRVATIARQ